MLQTSLAIVDHRFVGDLLMRKRRREISRFLLDMIREELLQMMILRHVYLILL